MWSLAVRQAVKVNGSTYERPSNPHYGGNDAVILSTDANPSPGLSRVGRLLDAFGSHAQGHSRSCRRSLLARPKVTFRSPRAYLGQLLEQPPSSKARPFFMLCLMPSASSNLVSLEVLCQSSLLIVHFGRWDRTANHQGSGWQRSAA